MWFTDATVVPVHTIRQMERFYMQISENQARIPSLQISVSISTFYQILGYVTRTSLHHVQHLQDQLENKEYSAELAAQKCKELADMIKQRVKAEGYRRHKLVSLVTIIENKNAALSMGSRCVWNDKFDNYADGTFKNNSLYAVGCLYGIYCE